jgi:toxin ParE1/3/4
MKYTISNEATRDLEKIWLYTLENWSMEQADRYINLIIDEIENIAKDPLSGNDFGELRKGYFRTRVKSHFIFYKISSRRKEVEVVRILHQRMDIESRLND